MNNLLLDVAFFLCEKGNLLHGWVISKMTKGCGMSDGCFGVNLACKQGKGTKLFHIHVRWGWLSTTTITFRFHILQSEMVLRKEKRSGPSRVLVSQIFFLWIRSSRKFWEILKVFARFFRSFLFISAFAWCYLSSLRPTFFSLVPQPIRESGEPHTHVGKEVHTHARRKRNISGIDTWTVRWYSELPTNQSQLIHLACFLMINHLL